MNTTVPTGEPKGYAVTAAELRRIADALDALPPGDKPLSGQVYMFPDGGADAVDALVFAINGERGETKLASDGWVRTASIHTEGLTVCVRANVPPPPDERDAEIERLRSELAEARVRAMPVPNVDQTPTRHMRAGFGYNREADDPEPGAVPGGVDGHSEFSGRASVPDMQTRPQCSPACRDLYRPDRGVHFLGCPNWSTPMTEQNGGE